HLPLAHQVDEDTRLRFLGPLESLRRIVPHERQVDVGVVRPEVELQKARLGLGKRAQGGSRLVPDVQRGPEVRIRISKPPVALTGASLQVEQVSCRVPVSHGLQKIDTLPKSAEA